MTGVRLTQKLVAAAQVLAVGVALAVPASAGAATFTSTTGLGSPPASGPSSISVSGLEGTVTKVRATLNSVDHQDGTDMDVLLVGPAGQSSILMSDTCTALVNDTFTFDDASAGALGGSCPSGTFKPTDITDFGADGFVNPAPPGPYQAGLAIFNNRPPNGTWSTFLTDDQLDASGGGFNSWTLELETSGKAGVQCDGVPASFVGSPGNDVIRGTPARDVIAALGGNDRVFGLRGSDLICGGDDNDKLNGGPGRDRLVGDAGRDKCVGGPKKDSAVTCEKRKKI